MPAVVEPPPWLLWWSRPRVLGAFAAGWAAVGLGIAAAPLAGDLVLGAAAAGLSGLAGWAWSRRARLDRLPLVLGEVAVRQALDREPVLRTRAWLGHGREMRDIEATATLHPPAGDPVPLGVDVPAVVATGPITLTIALPALAIGEVGLQVRVVEDGTLWTATRRYALQDAPHAPLDVPVRTERGRMRWHRAAWDRVRDGATEG